MRKDLLTTAGCVPMAFQFACQVAENHSGATVVHLGAAMQLWHCSFGKAHGCDETRPAQLSSLRLSLLTPAMLQASVLYSRVLLHATGACSIAIKRRVRVHTLERTGHVDIEKADMQHPKGRHPMFRTQPNCQSASHHSGACSIACVSWGQPSLRCSTS